jgi:hypothetical protein
MKEQRQLGRRPAAVLLGEAQHRVLHDVQRSLLVAYGKNGLLECPPLDGFEKRRELAP